MRVSVAFVQDIKCAVTLSFVDSRSETTECVALECRSVQKGSDERSGTFSPMVVATIGSTSTGYVNKAARRKYRAVPLL
jgi:hypothetical protein